MIFYFYSLLFHSALVKDILNEHLDSGIAKLTGLNSYFLTSSVISVSVLSNWLNAIKFYFYFLVSILSPINGLCTLLAHWCTWHLFHLVLTNPLLIPIKIQVTECFVLSLTIILNLRYPSYEEKNSWYLHKMSSLSVNTWNLFIGWTN